METLRRRKLSDGRPSSDPNVPPPPTPHFGHGLRTEVLTLTVSLLLRYPRIGFPRRATEYGMAKGTMLRLSKYFLLLDFLYDQSMMDGVVRNGDCIRKKIARIDEDSEVFSEGRFLCESILDRVVKQHGPVSIAAGLWFKQLPGQRNAHDSTSSGGVHQWRSDTGAAADIVAHSWVNREMSPTTFLKEWVVDNKWHRARSYRGSEFCCLASRARGNDPTRPSYKCREENWRRRPYSIQSPGGTSITDLGYERRTRKARIVLVRRFVVGTREQSRAIRDLRSKKHAPVGPFDRGSAQGRSGELG